MSSPPRPRVTRLAPLAALAVLASAAGCSEDFDPYNRLTTLRVLAIQSEPVAPPSGASTTLTPLVFTPPDVEVESYAWSWCPLPGASADGYPCLVTEAEAAELAGGELPPFDLGSEPTATLANTVDPARLAALCAAAEDIPGGLDCEGGFPVQIKLTVTTADTELTTIRRLRFGFGEQEVENANPTLDALVAEIGGEERPLDGDDAVTLPRDEETTIRVGLSEASSESFDTTDVDGEPVTERERLYLSWFVESGDTDDEHTGFIDGAVTIDAARENTWTPARNDDYARGESAIVVIVRDNRDGVTWRIGGAALSEEP